MTGDGILDSGGTVTLNGSAVKGTKPNDCTGSTAC